MLFFNMCLSIQIKKCKKKFACSCWDINDNAAIWWVIKGPVLAPIMVNIPSQKTLIVVLIHLMGQK